MRISEKMLETQCNIINNLRKTPEKAYDRIEGKFKANIGNYHLYFAYGSVGLHKMVNEGGGVHEVFGLTTKRELFNQLQSYIRGILND